MRFGGRVIDSSDEQFLEELTKESKKKSIKGKEKKKKNLVQGCINSRYLFY